ncbi:MAG: exosortase/archaeosortase family protein [Candidatus Diapherotrites archaeon]|nr:exosortase/archaeosortase family protein [Candidatus Diapherotrites archaeon]
MRKKKARGKRTVKKTAAPSKKNFGKKAALFLAKFFVIYGALQALLLAAPLGPLLQWIAATEAGALGLQSSGNEIIFSGFSLLIGQNCSGLMSGSVLAAIVFSLRRPGLRKKIALALGGAAALFIVNLARLYFVLLWAMDFGAGSAEAAHTATWFLMAGAIFAIWYCLTKKIAGTESFAEML